MKFSVRYGLGMVAAIATAAAALARPNYWWSILLTVGMFFLLATSVIGAAFGRRETRIFWCAFAVFGWLALAFMTSPLANQMYLRPATVLPIRYVNYATENLGLAGRDETSAAYSISHAVIVLTFAYVGGVSSQLFFGQKQPLP